MQDRVKKSVEAPSRKVVRAVPIGWGKSELTQFLEIAEQQTLASFVILPRWVQALELIDANLTTNAPTYFHELDAPRQTAAKLFIRAFGTYRAACRLALSGQVFEATVLTRSVIESGVYAWACGHSQEHRDAWNARADGDAQRSEAKRKFSWSGLTTLLKAVAPNLAERVAALYQETIDNGAHPNVEGVLLSSEVNPISEDRYSVSPLFIHGDEAVLLVILALIRAMELVYGLLELTIGDRLRILGVDRRVDEERRFVIKLIEDFERDATP